MTNTLFTACEMQPIHNGLRDFIHSISITSNRQAATERDLIDVLGSVAYDFRNYTTPNKTTNDNVAILVKDNIQEHLLVGLTPHESGLKRHKYLPMYLLVVAPVLELINTLPQPSYTQVASVVNTVIGMVNSFDEVVPKDTAFVTDHIQRIVTGYSAQNPITPYFNTTKGTRKRYSFLDGVAPTARSINDDDEDEFSASVDYGDLMSLDFD